MNSLALNVHRRALTAAGSFYTRNLDAKDRSLLQSVHQCLVRSSAESQLEGLISSVVEQPYDQTCQLVPVSFADMAFFGPRLLAAGAFAFDTGPVKILPRLDPAARGVAVGSYLYDVREEGTIPDGLRHGGFWTIPWEGEPPDSVMSDLGMLVRDVDFWFLAGALAFTANPRELFPQSSIVVENSRRMPAPLLTSVWGRAGLNGAAWQTTGEAGLLARSLLIAGGLSPGPATITHQVPLGDKFLLTTADGRLVLSHLTKLGRLTPLQCLEQSAEVALPDAANWWQSVGQLSPIYPVAGIAVCFSALTIKFTSGDAGWPGAAMQLRADLGADSDRFWAWADTLQLATGNFWSTRLGITTAGETVYRRGFDFFLHDLGHESRMLVVVDRALGETQRADMQRCAKLHSSHNFFINFAAP